jgi:hypothetical protein
MNKFKEETLMKKKNFSTLSTEVYVTISSSILMLATVSGIVLADGDSSSVTGPLDRLTNLLYDIVAGLGVIALIFGILQLALAFKTHDPQQKLAAAIGIVAGIILIAIRGIVALIRGY